MPNLFLFVYLSFIVQSVERIGSEWTAGRCSQ